MHGLLLEDRQGAGDEDTGSVHPSDRRRRKRAPNTEFSMPARLSEAYAQLPNRPIWQAMKDSSLRAGELR